MEGEGWNRKISQDSRLKRSRRRKFVFFAVGCMGFCAVIKWSLMESDLEKRSLQTFDGKSGAECIEVLEEFGLVLPDSYQTDRELAEKTVKMILDSMDSMSAEDWKSGGVAYNYTELYELTKQIYEIVK